MMDVMDVIVLGKNFFVFFIEVFYGEGLYVLNGILLGFFEIFLIFVIYFICNYLLVLK